MLIYTLLASFFIFSVRGEKFPAAGLIYPPLEGTAGLWPGNKIPYEFNGVNADLQDLVLENFMYIEEMICVDFVERDGENDYLEISTGAVCEAHFGHVLGAGKHKMILSSDCEHDNRIIRMLALLVISIPFEHNRPDRDVAIQINWETVANGTQQNFWKRPNPDDIINVCKWSSSKEKYDDCTSNSPVEITFGEYDFSSIMHYKTKAHSKSDSGETITFRGKGAPIEPGNTDEMSRGDLRKAFKILQCVFTPPPSTTTSPPTPCPSDEWTETKKICYLRKSDFTGTFDEAKSHCMSNGGVLLTAEKVTEVDFKKDKKQKFSANLTYFIDAKKVKNGYVNSNKKKVNLGKLKSSFCKNGYVGATFKKSKVGNVIVISNKSKKHQCKGNFKSNAKAAFICMASKN